MREENLALLKEEASRLQIELNERQLAAFDNLYAAVTTANEQFNLTAITDEYDFTVKHFVDSLTGVRHIPKGSKVLDIGTGGGFPSAPIAIAREDVSVVGLDSTLKKISFLNATAKKLGIDNLRGISMRAEDARELFGAFDVVTARAVAPLNILCELASPLLKMSGLFIAYKTDENEVDMAKNALKVLNMQIVDIDKLALCNGDKRILILIKKCGETPKGYPRQYGTIKKRPL